MTNRDPREPQVGADLSPSDVGPAARLDGLPEVWKRFEPVVLLGQSPLGRTLGVRERITGREGILRLADSASIDGDTIGAQVDSARQLLGLEHPHLAPLLDLGNSALGPYVIHGLPFPLAALAPGTDEPAVVGLDRILAAEESEPLPPRLALELCRQLFSAVDALHGRGWLLEPAPSDVLVEQKEGGTEVYLVDFGLIRHWQRRADLGATGFVVGRLKYTAPELFEARNTGASDRGSVASDLYALGLVAYEVLTGRFPIPGDSPASLIAGHLFQPPLDFLVSDPSERIPDAARELLVRLLAKHPDGRPDSAAEVVSGLGAALDALPPENPEKPEPEVSAGWAISGALVSGSVAATDDPVATTRQLSPEELRRAMESPPPPGSEGRGTGERAEDEITDDAISDLLAEASAATTRAVPTEVEPPGSGDLRSMTPSARSDHGPELSSVTMPMQVVEQAKQRHAEKRRYAEGVEEQVPSVTIPMATVSEARRRHAERETGGSPPPPPVPRAASPQPPPAQASPPEPTPPEPTPPEPTPPEPTPPQPTPPEPDLRPGPTDLSDLGFGGDSGSALDRARRHAEHHSGRRSSRSRSGRRSRGGALRWLGPLLVVLGVGLVFSLSYLLSGRGLDFQDLLGGGSEPPTASDTTSLGEVPAASPSSDSPSSGPEAAPVQPAPAARAAADLPPGMVKIDALPWAHIESLVDASGEAVIYSGARTTPKVLELPPGDYRLVLVHPPSGGTQTLELTVESRETLERRVSFVRTVEDFLDVAGW